MKKHVRLVSVIAGVLSLMAGAPYVPGAITMSSRDWTFVESVGGIRIDDPVRQSDGAYLLPVHCDVSGVHTTTRNPTTMNSALAVWSTHAETRDGVILVTIRTCMAWGPGLTCEAPAARLGRLEPGEYRVAYLNRDGSREPLRVVHIGSD